MTGAGRPGAELPLEPVLPPSSFTALLAAKRLAPTWDVGEGTGEVSAAEATTVLALVYQDGVVMVGDRQATEGTTVAHRRVQKVYPADNYSAVAISGVAGIAVQLVRLFRTELEHYEKIEGVRLSLEGKANYLASMVRGQLSLAFQGLVVVPLFCGYDEFANVGRLYSFDVVGGSYEEQDYAATGSGGREARSFLRGTYEAGLDEEGALLLSMRALVAAAEEDTATAGPDLRRGIYPNVVIVSPDGYVEVEDDRVVDLANRALETTA